MSSWSKSMLESWSIKSPKKVILLETSQKWRLFLDRSHAHRHREIIDGIHIRNLDGGVM